MKRKIICQHCGKPSEKYMGIALFNEYIVLCVECLEAIEEICRKNYSTVCQKCSNFHFSDDFSEDYLCKIFNDWRHPNQEICSEFHEKGKR